MLFPKFGLELPVAQILRDFGAFLIGLTEPHLNGLNADGLLEAGRVDLDALVEEVPGVRKRDTRARASLRLSNV